MGTVISLSDFTNSRRAAQKQAELDKARTDVINSNMLKVAKSLLVGDMQGAYDSAIKINEAKANENKFMPAYCDPSNEFRGSKYNATKGLSLKDVATRIRGDVKQMIGAGILPKGLKVSVRMDGYNALRVNITAFPAGMIVYNPAYVRATRNFQQPSNEPMCDLGGMYSKEVQQIMDMLNANTISYNRGKSDIMSDYFSVRFYDGRADIDGKIAGALQKTEAVNLDQ